MLMILMLLAWAAGLVCLVSYIWLTVVAFKKSLGWGLAVFFLPLAFIVFAVKHWTEAKMPFLVHAGSVAVFFVAVGSAMLGMVSQIPTGELTADDAAAFIESTMDQMEKSGMLDAKEQQELDRMRATLQDIKAEAGTAGNVQPSPSPETTTIQLEQVAGDSTSPELPSGISKSTRSLPKDLISRHRRSSSANLDGSIPLSEAADHIGEMMRIQGQNVDTFGRLTKVEADRFTFERRLAAGLVYFELGTRDIETLTIIER
jgi:hypothetical protein